MGPITTALFRPKNLIADILPPPNYIIESYMLALQMANEADEKVDAATMDPACRAVSAIEGGVRRTTRILGRRICRRAR